MTVTISRLYDTYADAQSAVRGLEAAGVPHSDISIVANNSDNWYGADKKVDRDRDGVDDRAEGAGKGAGIGAGIGGAAGLLAGLGSPRKTRTSMPKAFAAAGPWSRRACRMLTVRGWMRSSTDLQSISAIAVRSGKSQAGRHSIRPASLMAPMKCARSVSSMLAACAKH